MQGLRSPDVFQAVAAADEGVEELGGDAAEEQHGADGPGRVVQLPAAQRSRTDDLQGTLLLGGRRVGDNV